MGFSEIYLVGVDMSFSHQRIKKINSRNWVAAEPDPNHFDPRYFAKGKKYHNPTVHQMIEKFEEGKVFFNKQGVKIFNAGIGGNLEVFPRIDFLSLFSALSRSAVEDALNSVACLQQKGYTLRYLEDNASHLDSECKVYPEIFRTTFTHGAGLIPSLAGNYISIGPYNGHYYFIRASK
jgi:hypothetical protein